MVEKKHRDIRKKISLWSILGGLGFIGIGFYNATLPQFKLYYGTSGNHLYKIISKSKGPIEFWIIISSSILIGIGLIYFGKKLRSVDK